MGSLRSLLVGNRKAREEIPQSIEPKPSIVEPSPYIGFSGKNWFEPAIVYAPYLDLFVMDHPKEGIEVSIEATLVI